MMFLVFAALLADHVKKGPDATVVKNDNQSKQNSIKGAHKDKMNRIIGPLKSKWKHDDTFLWIQFSLLRKNGQIPV